MSWCNESHRHSMAARGIDTKNIEYHGYEISPFNEQLYKMHYKIVDKLGKFDRGVKEGGAYYIEKNPFISHGLQCCNCLHWQGNNICAVVKGSIKPNAVCRLWVIPDERMRKTCYMSSGIRSTPFKWKQQAELEALEKHEGDRCEYSGSEPIRESIYPPHETYEELKEKRRQKLEEEYPEILGPRSPLGPISKRSRDLKSRGIKTDPDMEVYNKWKQLVNMTPAELQKFMDSKEGKQAGLSKEKAKQLGIKHGRESAEWILRMKKTPVNEWTPEMWRWARRQNNFISRMSGNKGPLYKNGQKTRKHTALLIWGNDPEKLRRY